jgi:hypothetical protein
MGVPEWLQEGICAFASLSAATTQKGCTRLVDSRGGTVRLRPSSVPEAQLLKGLSCVDVRASDAPIERHSVGWLCSDSTLRTGCIFTTLYRTVVKALRLLLWECGDHRSFTDLRSLLFEDKLRGG